ncbi:MAG: PRTRC system ThiF family protein [Bacteroidales bacterium]|nr:PRTRC system ThiF family protein [Bacteroidales bacterium]
MDLTTHKVPSYIVSPTHEVTIVVIGVGGTGSQVLNILARMHIALKALGHPGFNVTAIDPDTVSESNIGRQSFFHCDIGQNKALNLISKINMAFGLNWNSISEKLSKDHGANIMITCTDNVSARKDAYNIFFVENNKFLDYKRPYYWLDFGNSSTFGQAILASADNELKDVFHFHPEMEANEDPNEPSCSMIEALEKQDLLINSTLANLGMNMIWRLFRELEISYNGLYLNLKDLSVSTIKIDKKCKQQKKSHSKKLKV